MNDTAVQVSSFESRLNKVISVQDDLWEVCCCHFRILQNYALCSFFYSETLLESLEQDISKLRRDVKTAFEDMTSQMNRYNENHSYFAIYYHNSSHCDEQFLGCYIASDHPVISCQGLITTIFATFHPGTRQSFSCSSSSRHVTFQERGLALSYFSLS